MYARSRSRREKGIPSFARDRAYQQLGTGTANVILELEG